MFKEHQNIYANTKKYSAVKIKNDQRSWEKVYNEIEKHRKAIK